MIVLFAKEAGFDFTFEEMNAIQPSPAGTKLIDEELDMVAGGKSMYPSAIRACPEWTQRPGTEGFGASCNSCYHFSRNGWLPQCSKGKF